MALLLVLAGCSSLDNTSSAAEVTEVTEEDVLDALSGWEDFTAYTPAIEPSDASPDVWFEVLINDIALRWLDDDAAEEEGISIIRPVYDADHPDSMTALTMMFKVPGSSLETDDWQWAKASPDGEILDFGNDTTQSCSSCHAAVKDTNHWLLEVEL